MWRRWYNTEEWIWVIGRIILIGGNRRVRRKSSPSATVFTTKHLCSSLGLNPCLCVENNTEDFIFLLRGTSSARRLSVAMQQNCHPHAAQCPISRGTRQEWILQSGRRLHSLCSNAAVSGFRFDLYTPCYILELSGGNLGIGLNCIRIMSGRVLLCAL